MANNKRRSLLVSLIKVAKATHVEIRDAAEESYKEATGEALQFNLKRTIGRTIGHTIAMPKRVNNHVAHEYNSLLDYLEDKSSK